MPTLKSLNYLLKKFLALLSALFLVITFTFLLMKALPGDPFDDEQALPKEIHAALRAHYGLDQPWLTQYKNYLYAIVHFDLGPSLKYQDRTVNSIIRDGFAVSAILGLEALVLATSAGVLLGTLAAIKVHRWPDHAIIILTTMGVSIPSFILATLLQYIFAIKIPLLPLARWESWTHSVLPALALAAMPTAFIARLIRSNMCEILQSEYIKTAKAKGLASHTILWRHALRNAFLPVLTYMGQMIANILVGSFIIEKIFSIPGLGQWFVNSVSHRDYSAIMGLTIFYSALLLGTTFIVDIAYRYLDPRIQRST